MRPFNTTGTCSTLLFLKHSGAGQQAYTYPFGCAWVVLRPSLHLEECLGPVSGPPLLDLLFWKLNAHGLIGSITLLSSVQHLSDSQKMSVFRLHHKRTA